MNSPICNRHFTACMQFSISNKSDWQKLTFPQVHRHDKSKTNNRVSVSLIDGQLCDWYFVCVHCTNHTIPYRNAFDCSTKNVIVDGNLYDEIPIGDPKMAQNPFYQVSTNAGTNPYMDRDRNYFNRNRSRSQNNGSHVNGVHLFIVMRFVECYVPDAFCEWETKKRLKMDYKGDCINHIGCHCVLRG